MSMRVLIVDDEPSILAAMAPLLRSRGYDVSTAMSGRGALDAVERDQPDLIVLDLGLADTDGIEICRLIRDGSSTPIIVLSARGQESDKVAALDAGADDYVTKPFGVKRISSSSRSTRRRSRSMSRSPIAICPSGAPAGSSRRSATLMRAMSSSVPNGLVT